MNITSLEFEGVNVLYEFYVNAQVRCMTLKPIKPGYLLLAVGDKNGYITLCTISRSNNKTKNINNELLHFMKQCKLILRMIQFLD